MTKVKAKPKAKKAEKSEQYILASGSFTQSRKGVRIKFECGDLVSPSPQELKSFPMKFLTLAEYESLLEGDRRLRKQERAMQDKMTPPRVSKLGARDAESIKRGKRLLKMKRSTQRRILIT